MLRITDFIQARVYTQSVAIKIKLICGKYNLIFAMLIALVLIREKISSLRTNSTTPPIFVDNPYAKQ